MSVDTQTHTSQNDDMSKILSPLDQILQLTLDLINASHSAKRNSLQDNTLQTIISNVNETKNHIINLLFNVNKSVKNFVNDSQTTPTFPLNTQATYANVTKSSEPTNNIIIPLGNTKPENNTVIDTERKIVNILKKTNSNATVISTNATDKGNIVIKFKRNDDLNALKSEVTQEFGNKIKLISHVLPKIKIVGVPSFFDTTNKDDALNSIVNANKPLQQLLKNKEETFEFLFAFKSKVGQSLVIKCSPNVRALIKSHNDSLIVEHKQCRVFDRFFISHCGKCALYGHTRRNCTSSSINCTYCAKSHDSLVCPEKDNISAHACFNCQTSNNENFRNNALSHNSFSDDCPVFLHLKNKLISRTDFGFPSEANKPI